jgi:hypothetical protein
VLEKLNRYLIKVSVLLIMAALIVGTAGCNYVPPSQDLEIRTWYDLDAVRDNLAGNHTLMNNLDSTTEGYEELASPTANGGDGWQPTGVFRGTFDGQGHEIRDLFINRSDRDHGGLFSLLYEGVINNIGVVNATVIGMHYIGGLAGENDQGTINNSYCTGSITGNVCVGGLVGLNEGTVSSSYFRGNVTSNGYYVGGLVGENQKGIIDNAYYNYDEVLINRENIITVGALFNGDFDEWLANDKSLDVNARLSRDDGYYVVGNVTDFKQLLIFGQDNSLKFRLASNLDLGDEPNFYIPYLGGEFDGDGYSVSGLSFNFSFVCQVGLFGYIASTGRLYEVAADNVSIAACRRIGGLVGASEGTVSDSHSTGSVIGDGWWVGGLVGYSIGAVNNSSSASDVIGDYYVGGLVGYNSENAIASNSYFSGKVSGSHVIGGLVGDNRGTISNSYSSGSVSGILTVGGLAGKNLGHMSDCFSTGTVTGSDDVGGLVGSNSGTVSNSFWDTQTSGQATSDGGTGKNTTEMQDIATFTHTETEGLNEPWDIIAVGGPGERNPAYIWNIVNGVTYPFLSWET